MKRKNFIITASLLAVGLPVAYYVKKHNSQPNPLITPDLLSRFCDDMVLKAMGTNYRSLIPEEDGQQKLTDLILTDADGKKVKPSDWTAVEKLIAKKSGEDFSSNKTIVLQGWVISLTEARQCALLSLTSNKN
jgi:hypothetical protein